ncbi:MAG: hypothetical protein HOH03_04145, partial [Candidatus Marinimicrobia bacterium]|nr:hypothetical protein [Candidatus Neomarinimicrobiota bacterium]
MINVTVKCFSQVKYAFGEDQFILELLGDSLIGPGTGLLKFITIMQGLLLTYGIINRMQSL